MVAEVASCGGCGFGVVVVVVVVGKTHVEVEMAPPMID